MISRIRIKNFQSHQDTEMSLHPGVNVLVGSSDSGKSSVFRALTWVIRNRPLGTAFMQWGAKKTEVAVEVGGRTVCRSKTKSKNLYLIGDAELQAGTEVPADVRNLLNIDPEITIQPQISPPFLLASSPGEVASFFNNIAGLSDIDLSLKNLKSWLTESKRNLKSLDYKIERLSEEEQKLDYLPEAEAEIVRAEKAQEKLVEVVKDIDTLGQYRFKYQRCAETMDEVRHKAEALNHIKGIENKAGELSELEDQINRIERAITLYRANQNVWKIKMRKEAAVALLTNLEKQAEKLNHLGRKIMELEHTATRYKDLRGDKRQREQTTKVLQAKIKETMPNECPLCGQEVNDE